MLASPTSFSVIRNHFLDQDDVGWARALLSDTRIVSAANKCVRYFDEPLLYQYAAVTSPPPYTSFCGSEGSQVGGASFSEHRAMLKTAGEAAERFSSSCFNPSLACRGSFHTVTSAPSPDKFKFFTDEQLSWDAF